MLKLKKAYHFLDASKRLHQCPKPLIGLTGGIGTGKSTVARLLEELGLTIIDADELVHDIYDDKETLSFVSALCPGAVKGDNLDFSILRKIAFHEKDLLQKLEHYIYKRLPMAFVNEVKSSSSDVIIYDVPLLFEKELNSQVDLSVVVYATPLQQKERASKRDQCPDNIIKKVIEKQISIDKKKELADTYIDNTKDLSFLKKQVESFVSTYLT